MKITALETFRPRFQPNVLVLRLQTDEGYTGLGETFYGASAVEAYLHDTVAPVLLGLVTEVSPERVGMLLAPYVGYQGGGVETRGNGAVDVALWDLLGKRSGLPIVDLLGGAVRDGIRIYNTCAGPGYVSATSRQESANWGTDLDGCYEDLQAFLSKPGQLARDLLDEGIPGMKIWPFDRAAEKTGGTDISPADIESGLRIVEEIRNAVGADIDLMIELHSLWNRHSATKICQALTPYDPYWVEDPIRVDSADSLARLAADVDVPLASGETCVGRRGFLPLLARGVIRVATVDVQWTGGLTEARKIASLADAYSTPVAPHDCTGPVSLAASTHLVLSQPNGLIQETVRAFRNTWYGEIATGLPVVTDGVIRVSNRPGLGVELRPDMSERSDVHRRISELA